MNSKKPSSLTRFNDDDLITMQNLFDILIGWNCAVSNNQRGAVSAGRRRRLTQHPLHD